MAPVPPQHSEVSNPSVGFRDGASRFGIPAATVGLLVCVLIHCLVGSAAVDIGEADPRYNPFGGVTIALGPFGLALLQIISLCVAGMGATAYLIAGGRIRWVWTILVLGGVGACLYHGVTHFENLVRTNGWLTAAIMALVAVHLAEHGRARKLMVAAMIAMTVPLALDAVLYVWSLHPTQLELHREHLGRFLQSKGWRPGSPHHLAYEHRIEQNDAVGTFGLSNLLGSVAACFMVLVVPLVLGRIKAMGWRSSLIPLCTVLCGLTLIALTRSKGAVGALAIGLLLLAMAWHLRVTGNTWVRRLLGPMAIAVLFIVIGIVVIRGMLGPPQTLDGERSLLFRYYYWQAAVSMMFEQPWSVDLLGMGPVRFRDLYAFHKNPLNPEQVSSSHNGLVDSWVMLGGGGLMWGWLMLMGLWHSARHTQDPDLESVEIEDSAQAARIRFVDFGWPLLLALGLFITQMTITYQGMAYLERIIVWTVGAGGFLLVTTWLMHPSRFCQSWLRLGLFGAAGTLLAHAQIEMSFFHQGTATIGWFVIAVVSAKDWPSPPNGRARISKSGFILPVLIAVLVGWFLIPSAMAMANRQRALAATASELIDQNLIQAIYTLDHAIDAIPNDPTLYLRQVKLRMETALQLQRQADSAEADRHVERALAALDQANRVGLDDLALVYTRVRLLRQAARLLNQPELAQYAIQLGQELLERDPYGINSRLLVAGLLWEVGRLDAASGIYRRCLELNDQTYLAGVPRLSEDDLVLVKSRAAWP